LAAAAAALQDQEYVTRSASMNRQGMQQLTAGLTSLGLDYIPSLGNFVAFDCGRDAQEVFNGLLKKGVIVRPVAEYGLPHHIRVSIGLPEENQRFLTALPEVLA